MLFSSQKDDKVIENRRRKAMQFWLAADSLEDVLVTRNPDD